jgi:hypothetical protein
MGRPSYYDDNYGHWEINGEEDLEYYRQTQAASVRKKCSGCGRTVKIKPDYAYCNGCAEKIERGWDVSG